MTVFIVDNIGLIGALENGSIRSLGPAADFYANPAAAMSLTGGEIVSIDDVKLAPAVPETARVFCVGINYRSHAGGSKELAGIDEPKAPKIFGRWPRTLVVDGGMAIELSSPEGAAVRSPNGHRT